jgi:predicted permease
VLLLFGATGLLLLIACANVANLTLARMMQRERELAVRSALGASRWRLFQQVATEAVVVASLAFACATGIAHAGLSLLVSFAARVSPRVNEISLNGEVMLFCGAVSLVAALLAYLLPVQSAIGNLVGSTRQGGHGATAGKSRTRARGLLVTAQVALSFVLLTGAGLLFRSFLMVSSVELGAKPERVVVMTVSPNWSNIRDGNQFRQFFENVLRRVREVPGVSMAGVGARVPLNQRLPFLRNFVIEGQSDADRNARPVLDLASAGPGYFEALGIPLLRGRVIAGQDHSEAPLVAVASDSFARHHWPSQDPIGRRVSLDGGRRWISIIGVVGDVRHYGLERDATEQLYTSFSQGAGGTNIVIRTAMDPASLLPQFRQAVYAVDAESAIASLETMEWIRAESLAPRRVTTMLLGLFSGITLLITLAGISGVAALVVSQKLPEIGIRLALGAKPGQMVAMLLGQQMRMVMLGVVIGVTASLALTKWLSTFLYRTQAADPLTYTTVVALVVVATALACLVPARRAAWTDPLKSLRSDA